MPLAGAVSATVGAAGNDTAGKPRSPTARISSNVFTGCALPALPTAGTNTKSLLAPVCPFTNGKSGWSKGARSYRTRSSTKAVFRNVTSAAFSKVASARGRISECELVAFPPNPVELLVVVPVAFPPRS